MRIVFVRHGESEANVQQVYSNTGWKHPLTAAGREQARLVAESLAGTGVVVVFSSPLQRAAETAQAIAARLEVPIDAEPALSEYQLGLLEGRPYHEGGKMVAALEARWRNGASETRMPRGESREDILARFVPFVQRMIDEYGRHDVTVVLVGHAGTFAQALPEVMENLDPAFVAAHPLGYASRVEARLHGEDLRCESWDGIRFDA